MAEIRASQHSRQGGVRNPACSVLLILPKSTHCRIRFSDSASTEAERNFEQNSDEPLHLKIMILVIKSLKQAARAVTRQEQIVSEHSLSMYHSPPGFLW